MIWLVVLLAIVAGLGAFLFWVGRQSPTEPQSSHWPWWGSPDVVSTDRELQRALGHHHPHDDDDDKIVV